MRTAALLLLILLLSFVLAVHDRDRCKDALIAAYKLGYSEGATDTDIERAERVINHCEG